MSCASWDFFPGRSLKYPVEMDIPGIALTITHYSFALIMSESDKTIAAIFRRRLWMFLNIDVSIIQKANKERIPLSSLMSRRHIVEVFSCLSPNFRLHPCTLSCFTKPLLNCLISSKARDSLIHFDHRLESWHSKSDHSRTFKDLAVIA